MLPPNQLIGDWKKAEDVVEDIERGDLIEFRRVVEIRGTKRRIYDHWGVYGGKEDGQPFIIHISDGENDFEVRPGADSFSSLHQKIQNGSTAEVRSDLLSDVAREDMCRVNNSMDRHCAPLPPSIIVERATNMLGTGDYHFLQSNCEHFAKYCRYGRKSSDQVSVPAVALGVGLIGGITTFSVFGAVASAFCALFAKDVLDSARHTFPSYTRYL